MSETRKTPAEEWWEANSEAAPPRATTPREFLSEAEEAERSLNHSLIVLLDYTVAIDGKRHHAEKIKAMFRRGTLAGAPSRESGALLREYGEAVGMRAIRVTPESYAREEKAREALVARLSTLEQDAARMREALEFYAAGGHRKAIKALAALAPTGEPTTRPETRE